MNKTESGRKSSCPHGIACNSVSKRSSGAAASRIVRRKTRHQKVASETMGLNGIDVLAISGKTALGKIVQNRTRRDTIRTKTAPKVRDQFTARQVV